MEECVHLRTDIIKIMPRETIRELLELMENEPITIVSCSRQGTTLKQILDSFDNEFYLEEILAPQAEIIYKGKRAFGQATGAEPVRSLAWACSKLFLQDDNHNLRSRLIKLIAREQSRYEGESAACRVA